MRIVDQNGKVLDSVYLALSDGEALELIGALETLREASPHERFNQHVTDRGHQVEVTVYREGDPNTVFQPTRFRVGRRGLTGEPGVPPCY